MDVFSWTATAALFVFPKDVIPDSDMVFWMIPFSVILLHGHNDFGPISRWLNSHGCTLWTKLGSLSTYTYLLHFQIIVLCRRLITTDHGIAGSLLFLTAVIAFAALVMKIREKMPG